MSVRRPVVLAAAAIAALFVGAVILVDRLFAEPEGPRPQARPAAEALRRDTESRVAPPPAPLAPPPGPATAAAPAPEVPATGQPRSPGGRDLLSSLELARVRILECGGVTAEESEAGPRARRAQARKQAGQARTVLSLELESLEGQMAVRGVEVVSQGGADGEDLVRCARQELAGRALEASNAHPGRRMKMEFVVDRAVR